MKENFPLLTRYASWTWSSTAALHFCLIYQTRKLPVFAACSFFVSSSTFPALITLLLSHLDTVQVRYGCWLSSSDSWLHSSRWCSVGSGCLSVMPYSQPTCWCGNIALWPPPTIADHSSLTRIKSLSPSPPYSTSVNASLDDVFSAHSLTVLGWRRCLTNCHSPIWNYRNTTSIRGAMEATGRDLTEVDHYGG